MASVSANGAWRLRDEGRRIVWRPCFALVHACQCRAGSQPARCLQPFHFATLPSPSPCRTATDSDSDSDSVSVRLVCSHSVNCGSVLAVESRLACSPIDVNRWRPELDKDGEGEQAILCGAKQPASPCHSFATPSPLHARTPASRTERTRPGLCDWH